MKKNKKPAALLLLMMLVLLAACSNSAQEVAAVDSGLIEDAPTNEEILIDSLEYLLQEDETSSEEKLPDVLETQQEEAVEAPQTEVMIYYGNSASDTLNTEVSKMEQVTAENLIDALLKHNIVSLGTKVNSFEEEENGGVKTLRLDLSKTFYEYLKTMTKEGENIIMCSVAATFLEAYDADEIAITVEGSVLETDHATYEEPLRYKTQQLTSPKSDR